MKTAELHSKKNKRKTLNTSSAINVNNMNVDTITEVAKEEAKRIREILKKYKLLQKVKNIGDYLCTKVTKGTSLLIITFNDKKIADNMQQEISKYGYRTTLKDKTLSVSLIRAAKINGQTEFPLQPFFDKTSEQAVLSAIKNDKIMAIEKETNNQSVDDLPEYISIRDKKLKEDDDLLQTLKDRAKRIIGLVVHKFNIHSIKSDPVNGYTSSKITNTNVRGIRLGFKSRELALQVKTFLEGENYLVSIDGNALTINITKTPAEVKQIVHEEQSANVQQNKLIEELKDAVEKARTQHLSPEQIGNRIFDNLVNNHLFVIEGTKRISIEEVISGGEWPVWDKESFVLLVTDALK